MNNTSKNKYNVVKYFEDSKVTFFKIIIQQQESELMNTYNNVNVEKLANIYFEGKVISRTITFSDKTIKTLGVMLPGEYEFKTNSKELMEIISGELSVQLQEETNWNNIKEGMSFNVSKDSSFKVKVLKTTNYSCSYLD